VAQRACAREKQVLNARLFRFIVALVHDHVVASARCTCYLALSVPPSARCTYPPPRSCVFRAVGGEQRSKQRASGAASLPSGERSPSQGVCYARQDIRNTIQFVTIQRQLEIRCDSTE
jgi:hypothetical protein